MKKIENKSLTVVLVIVVAYFVSCLCFQNEVRQVSVNTVFPIETIVIDAGHGGIDGGAVSVSGALESEINLCIARKLEQMIAFCGMKPLMTRNDSNAVSEEGNTIREQKVADIKKRISFINNVDNPILISIHQNHFSESRYCGPQVFYAGTNSSNDFAILMQQCLCDALNPSNLRKCKKSTSVYLMDKILCTGVLVECGFLSNPHEDMLLQNSTYQKKIVCAIAKATAQYLTERVQTVEI